MYTPTYVAYIHVHARISMHPVGRLTPFLVHVHTHPSERARVYIVSASFHLWMHCLPTQYAESSCLRRRCTYRWQAIAIAACAYVFRDRTAVRVCTPDRFSCNLSLYIPFVTGRKLLQRRCTTWEGDGSISTGVYFFFFSILRHFAKF